VIGSLILALVLADPPGKDKETVPPELLQKRIEELGDDDVRVREEAACELAGMGSAADRAVPALMKALEREIRWTAPGPRARSTACGLRMQDLRLWHSVQGRSEAAAVEAYLRRQRALEPLASDPIPFALRQLHGGERAAAAVVTMIRREPGLRFIPQETASILGKLGPEAVPAFARALRDPNAQIRYVAVVALGHVEPASKAALAALRKAVEEQSGDVQHEAAAALDAIQSQRLAVAKTSR
jgi:HEAT repeat protein